MPLTAGTRLGLYEILAPIGAGGMGEVYRARDTRLGRTVALKLLPADYTTDPERLRRFEQEARSASALSHPGIVAIYEFGNADGQPFISMELVDGQTLRQLIAGPPLAPKRILHIAAQVADALAKAHAAGLVHRDLKPANVMVTSDGYAKILDFGLAKLVEPGAAIGGDSTITNLDTRPGTVLGTVAYMSPEQATGQPADRRSDQFAFGLILYEMLTGQHAFNRPTAVETLSAIIRDDPPAIDARSAAAYSAPLRWIVERCLAKSPDDRYASTQDLARDLATLRDRGSEITTLSAPPPRAMRIGGRETIAWGLAAALGLAALAFAMPGRGAPPPASARSMRFAFAAPPNTAFRLTIGIAPFAVSPDGQQVAFVGLGSGRTQLWLRSLDSLEVRMLAGTEGARSPFWSPDNREIGFFAGGHLKRISIPEGEVRTICESRYSNGGAWGRDGTIIFAPSVDSALYRVSADGGSPTPVTTLDPAHGESLHGSPAFLPAGRHFVFALLGDDNAGVYVESLDTKIRKRLLPHYSQVAVTDAGYLFFIGGDGMLLAQRFDFDRLELVGDPIPVAENTAGIGPSRGFAVSASGTVVHWTGDQDFSQLTWLKRDGTPVGTIGPVAGFMNVAISPDGQQIAVDRWDVAPAIWMVDVARGTLTRTTFDPEYVSTPVFSPDGRSLAYAGSGGTPPNLFLKPLDRMVDSRRLFRSRLQSFPQAWSGDRIVLLTVDPKTGSDLWTISASGAGEPTPLIRTPFAETYPRVSPDGKLIAYVSNHSGRQNVFVTTFPTPGEHWPVSPEGGSYPVWRRDSRELYYRESKGRLVAVSIDAGATTLKVSPPQPLFTPNAIPGLLGGGTFYDVAPDGRFLVNVHVERRIVPATVITNWTPPSARK